MFKSQVYLYSEKILLCFFDFLIYSLTVVYLLFFFILRGFQLLMNLTGWSMMVIWDYPTVWQLLSSKVLLVVWQTQVWLHSSLRKSAAFTPSFIGSSHFLVFDQSSEMFRKWSETFVQPSDCIRRILEVIASCVTNPSKGCKEDFDKVLLYLRHRLLGSTTCCCLRWFRFSCIRLVW